MTVIDKLASSLNRRNETPNQELAKQIVGRNDKTAVRELVENLQNKNPNIQSDCIKVLYEVGERKPALVSPFIPEFSSLLGHKNNRLVWGAMSALDTVSLEDPKTIYTMLPKIVEAADKGSVITRDHAVSILGKLASLDPFANKVVPTLMEQLKSCPTNKLPMYAENLASVITRANRAIFLKTLRSRVGDIEKESKRKRVEKVIYKLSQQQPMK